MGLISFELHLLWVKRDLKAASSPPPSSFPQRHPMKIWRKTICSFQEKDQKIISLRKTLSLPIYRRGLIRLIIWISTAFLKSQSELRATIPPPMCFTEEHRIKNFWDSHLFKIVRRSYKNTFGADTNHQSLGGEGCKLCHKTEKTVWVYILRSTSFLKTIVSLWLTK